jgi:hypothetical protein
MCTGVLIAGVMGIAGCASAPPLREAGFISDYSKLRVVDETRMNYVSDDLSNYRSFIIEPLVFEVKPGTLDDAQRAEVAAHFQQRLVEVLQSRGFMITTKPGPGVARVRMALTGVAGSEWWKKVYPPARFAGAGTGGAAMEAEMVDSVTKKQLGAVVQASPGNQFDVTAFSTVADVKSAIDKWAVKAGERLDAMHKSKQ